jgi:two-component system, OmpR family, sensor kinase
MDGFKERLRESIQLRLSLWLSVVILAVAVVAGSFSFVTAYADANELQDGTLIQVAALVGKQLTYATPNRGGTELDPELRLIVQAIGNGTANNPFALALPRNLKNGLQMIHLEDQSYRVLVQNVTGGKRIAVSQETTVRDEIAFDSALRTVLPLLIMVPILLLLVGFLVRQLLKPVTQLATEIDARTELELHPIQHAGVPTEIRPFVIAINRLLQRVADSMEVQRRFVADASHELRSPMAALSLQAEMLSNVDMPDEARKRLSRLRQGIDRGRNLLDQLLNLARAQATSSTPVAAISVQKVYRRVLEDLMPLAEAKHIDLGVSSSNDAQVFSNEMDLMVIVKNLVDNAIRYTPDGGRIDLSVIDEPSRVILEVEDSGVGIPEAERERVLDPFYRVLGSEQTGSGLGLSIVKTIAERLRGKILLNDATQFPQGLKVRIVLEKRQ